jgi:flagellin
MAMGSGGRINTNIGALNAYNALQTLQSKLATSQLRLATGKRINSVGDDPAGYTIAKQMEGRSRVLSASLNNLGDAQNLLTTAEGSLQTVRDILTSIKEKLAAFYNPVTDKDAIVTGIKEFAKQIQDIVANTNFNGAALFAVSGGTVGQTVFDNKFQVGVAADNTAETLSVTWGSSTATIGGITGSVALLSTGQVDAGTTNATAGSVLVGLINIFASFDGLASNAAAGATLTTNGANLLTLTSTNFVNYTTGIINADALSSAGAFVNNQIRVVETSLQKIGSYMQAIDAKTENLNVAITNIEAAKSRIFDADIAKEQLEATKLQILQQTALAQLGQANSAPQAFLSLFR